MAHFVDTGRPGEKPLTGKALADFQATCEEKGEPPPPPEWKGLSEEEVDARRAARVLQGGINPRTWHAPIWSTPPQRTFWVR